MGFVSPPESGMAVKLQSDGNSRGVIASAVDATAGDTTLVDPASGKNVRLYYIAYSAKSTNSGLATVYIRFGAGAAMYKMHLVPGAIFARNIGAGRYHQEGNTDENLIVNVSAGDVAVSYEYEIVPWA